ncbi:MAG: iron-containing alcohol dehydrogenase [Pseudomonadales bacterium]|nr:iron-containing alcohol dehydrogenase [Halieaceae bacterium]MCP5189726.1 iron-containing alcohol dehydrogenase [Pseudomonadales bacterium]MCP5204271.1 iron-containing alcohol dehydrogenase [Pseudomonadales bacterium]
MPMFLRKIKHAIVVWLMKTLSALSPGATHRAFVGSGSAAQLCRHILRSGARRILIVTDKPLRELGVADQAAAVLLEADVEVAFYDGVQPDPTYEQVAAGVAIARARGVEAILAIGGGSSIDAAKIIAASATSDEDPASWVGFGKVKHEVLRLFVIPTTSGTGSEATMGAVISDPVSHEKGIISGATLLPLAVALDSDLMLGLPAHITAATGMDALTHAIEAYIGVWERGTRLQDARMAVKLVFDNLAAACRDGSNREARDGMAMGAYYAGLAINQVNVGNVHAIAHQLGGKYGIPHGLANALVLPHVLEFCREESASRLAELALLLDLGGAAEGEGQLAHKFIQAVRNLRTEVGIPDHSDKLRREDFPYLAELAVAEGEGYPVPRLLDRQSVLTILERIAG